MIVLVGCEFSGVVRRAFKKRGHDSYSCDLKPSYDDSLNHLQMDVFDAIEKTKPDLLIAHPPCTYLAVSGARWFSDPGRREKQSDAIEFFRKLLFCEVHKVCVENPVGVISTEIRKPDQYIQPWMFGTPETKKTGLWLKNLPKLKPTNVVPKVEYTDKFGRRITTRIPRIWGIGKLKDRSDARSITYDGVAKAMAAQWG